MRKPVLWYVRCLDSTIPVLAISKVSGLLASFWSRAGRFESYLVAHPRRQIFSPSGSNDESASSKNRRTIGSKEITQDMSIPDQADLSFHWARRSLCCHCHLGGSNTNTSDYTTKKWEKRKFAKFISKFLLRFKPWEVLNIFQVMCLYGYFLKFGRVCNYNYFRLL